MKQWSALAAVAAAAGVAFVAGGTVSWGTAKPAPADEKKADDAKPEDAKRNVAVVHKTAVFNMAAVMRDFNQAKYQVWQLNNKKVGLSKNLIAWRAEYVQIQQELQKNPSDPKKDDKAKRMVTLARQIEDADRDINKQLNDDASAIIAGLHDKMKKEVDRIADENGFQLVLAYPDAITPEEKSSPYIKELKLKPPAAQPFYVDPEIDITTRVVKALNKKHPPLDAEGKPVDMSKLDAPAPLPPAPGVPGPAPKVAPSAPLPSVPMPQGRP